jgi:chemotaxis protein methyltransferase CheR
MTEQVLHRISDVVAAQMGLHFPPERWRDLERGIASAAREFGLADPDALAQCLLTSPLTRNRVEVLASHLTVGETYFFRDKRTFAVLEENILTELIRLREGTERRLRIWSAGCATGEEPYSIAILLHKLIPDWERWNITLLATDINPHFLRKASAGEYGEWSFRDTSNWLRERYFEKTPGGRFRIAPPIRKRVSFSYLNLAEDPYPSLSNDTNAMDVIFCRNVLMYFTPQRQKRVVDNFYRSLTEQGWLIVSPSEASHVLFSSFATVHFPSAILYRKASDNAIGTSGLSANGFEDATLRLPPATFLPDEPERISVVPEFHELLPSVAEERMERENPDDSNAMNRMARWFANQGQLTEALEWCEKALAADKLNAGCHHLRAMILQEQGATEQAIASLHRTLYLDPEFVMAHYSLGTLALRQGKAREAGKHFDHALSLLRRYRPEDIVPESDGMTAGRLLEVIQATVYGEAFA